MPCEHNFPEAPEVTGRTTVFAISDDDIENGEIDLKTVKSELKIPIRPLSNAANLIVETTTESSTTSTTLPQLTKSTTTAAPTTTMVTTTEKIDTTVQTGELVKEPKPVEFVTAIKDEFRNMDIFSDLVKNPSPFFGSGSDWAVDV